MTSGPRRWAIVLCCACLLSSSVAQQSASEFKSAITQALQAGENARAEELSVKAIARWPQDPDFVHYRGLAYFRSNHLEAAATDLEAARKMAPQDADTIFDLGLVEMARMRYENAAKLFAEAMKDPRRRRMGIAHLLLGRALQNSNQSEPAIARFKTALQLEPGLPLGHYHLGYAYQSTGDTRSAIEEYRKELARATGSAEVFYQLGHALIEAGGFAEAAERLRQSLALDANRADAQYDLGKVLLLQGDVEAAVPALEKAIALQPDSASAHFQLARALQKKGDKERAHSEMEKFFALKRIQKTTGGMATGRNPTGCNQ